MLWADNSNIPNIYLYVLVHLKSLKRRLWKNLNLKESYSKTHQEGFSKDYIVQVEQFICFIVESPLEWYLPHHPVLHPQKPGKVRRVINGAAISLGHSLNAAFFTGTDLFQSLIHVLRFRHQQQRVSADIEEKFLQVGVNPTNQLFFRFLWLQDPATNVAVFQYT